MSFLSLYRRTFWRSFANNASIFTSLTTACILVTGCSSTPPAPTLPDFPAASIHKPTSTWAITLSMKSALIPAINGETLYAGTQDGQIWAINLRNKSIEWHQSLGQPLQGTLSASAEMLAAETSDGQLLTLDTVSGKKIWERSINRPFHGAIRFLPDGLVVWAEDGSIVLLNKTNGEERWVHEATPTPLLLHAPKTGTLALGAIFTGTPSGKLAVIDTQSGHDYWQVDLTDDYHSGTEPLIDASGTPPLVNERHACASTPQRTTCVDRMKGSVAWTQPLGTITGLETDGLNLYGVTPDGVAFAVNDTSGREVWQYHSLGGHLSLKPEIMNNSVWLAPMDQPVLIQLNADTGNYQAAYNLPAPAQWMKSIDDHTLILQTNDGQIIQYTFLGNTPRNSGTPQQ